MNGGCRLRIDTSSTRRAHVRADLVLDGAGADGIVFEVLRARSSSGDHSPEPLQLSFERDGVELACLDFGGSGSPVLLLHGLAGHVGEWSETAGWMVREHRVVALDERGHGRSTRVPAGRFAGGARG